MRRRRVTPAAPANALTNICQQHLATAEDRKSGGGHPHLIVTVDADSLGSAASSPGSPGAMLGWVGPVNTTTAQRIGCDADVTVVAVGGPGGKGGAREIERTRRFFTTSQRVAMIARDGDRCAVPFCDRPVLWSDAHHLQAWATGGPTVIDNGALPCAAHHTLLHEGHWTLHRGDDGRYQITHPDGRTIGPEPHPPGHSRPPPQRT